MGGIVSQNPSIHHHGSSGLDNEENMPYYEESEIDPLEYNNDHTNNNNSVDLESKWRLNKTTKEARKEYELDGTLPKGATPEYLELREFLNDTKLLRPLGLFAKGYSNVEVLMCWIDIQEFKSIHADAVDYQRSTALHIYHKYVKANAACEIPDVDEELKESIAEILEDVKDEITDLPVNLYDEIQLKCFRMIYDKIFVQFKKSAYYEAVIADLKTNYNQVVPSDFEYLEKLGQGTFGLVVHVRKKSTGKHYALKVQPKIGLLSCYNDMPHRVDNEKQAIAACSHSFIVSMDYAFQTKSLICIAMDLGTAGTLLDALSSCENNRMNEDRVRFYTAEITLALAHLHRMGLIYRDLKPQNILLTEDGHIKLVDMGGVVDVSGKVMRNCNDIPEEALVLFAPDAPVATNQPNNNNNNSSMRGGGFNMSMSSLNPFADYSSDRKGGNVDGDDSRSNVVTGGGSSSVRGLGVGVSRATGSASSDNGSGSDAKDDTSGCASGGGGFGGFGIGLANSMSREYSGAKDYSGGGGNYGGGSSSSSSGGRQGGHCLSDDGSVSRGGVVVGGSVHKPAPPLGQTKRAKSVMGTHGYMAPEVLILLKQKSKDKKGYTDAVDWWSLGITMYKLLTGHLPFPNMNLVAFMNWCTVSKADLALLKVKGDVVEIQDVQDRAAAAGNYPEQYMAFLRALAILKKDFNVSSACLDIMLRFLDVVEERRLGYGPVGIKNVKHHKFLNKIQWELLEQRHIIPPYRPMVVTTAHNNTKTHSSLESVLVASGKQHWLTEHPTRAEQKNFKNWNYISPYIVKVEMGMEMIMEQYDDPFKNKQLLINTPANSAMVNGGGGRNGVGGEAGGTYSPAPYFNFRRPSASGSGVGVNNNNMNAGGVYGNNGNNGNSGNGSGGGGSGVNAGTGNGNGNGLGLNLSPLGLINSFRRLSNPSLGLSASSRRPSAGSIGTATLSLDQQSARGAPSNIHNGNRERRLSVGSASGNGGGAGLTNGSRRPSVSSASVASINGQRRGSNVSVISDVSAGDGSHLMASQSTRRSSFSKHQQVMRQLSDDTNNNYYHNNY